MKSLVALFCCAIFYVAIADGGTSIDLRSLQADDFAGSEGSIYDRIIAKNMKKLTTETDNIFKSAFSRLIPSIKDDIDDSLAKTQNKFIPDSANPMDENPPYKPFSSYDEDSEDQLPRRVYAHKKKAHLSEEKRGRLDVKSEKEPTLPLQDSHYPSYTALKEDKKHRMGNLKKKFFPKKPLQPTMQEYIPKPMRKVPVQYRQSDSEYLSPKLANNPKAKRSLEPSSSAPHKPDEESSLLAKIVKVVAETCAARRTQSAEPLCSLKSQPTEAKTAPQLPSTPAKGPLSDENEILQDYESKRAKLEQKVTQHKFAKEKVLAEEKLNSVKM